MRAVAVRPDAKRLEEVEHPEAPPPGPGEVRLQVLEVGVCGTDHEIVASRYGTPPEGEPYLVIGHEALARVLEVGEGAGPLAPGDLAVPMVRRPCGLPECVACCAGRPDFCQTGAYTERGILGAHGFLAERVTLPAEALVPAEAALREVAVLTEPLSIAEKALEQVADVQLRLPRACRPGAAGGDPEEATGDRAVVLGAGAVGVLGAMALAASGYRVALYSREPADGPKAALVRSFGAAYLSAEDCGLERVAREAGPVDLVYEAVGASRPAFRMMELLGPNAVFVFTGVPGRKAPVELHADRIMRQLVLRNQVLLGTVNAGRSAYQAALGHLAEFRRRWPEALAAVVAARHAFGDFRRPLVERLPGVKHVIRVAEGEES